MNNSPSPLRTFLLGRARQAPAALDPADMGTCFGLEMTLDQPPLAAADGPDAGANWWQRLSMRKTPAA
jgi:hypothetical protein